MNAAKLFEHFHRIGDAPDAIPRLRRFILDLAVRGKLVPQDPNDESASELLKRIAAEKARLAKVGEIKPSDVDPVSNDEPFPVPHDWTWTRLGAIGDWGSGSTPPRGNSDFYGGGITWLKSGELNDNRQLVGSQETVTELALAKGSFRLNRTGDVLMAMYGATIGRVAILAETAVTNQAVCGCTPFAGVFNQFLFLFLLSQRDRFRSASEGGAQPNISKVKIVETPFALPPLPAQHRIVAKVDQLMALCDRLEAAQAERESKRDRLTAASLARLNAPDPDPATFADDARFALNNLAAFTTRPDQINQLRQTILNLAVRGRLVPQDPSDEPASELLERIAGWRSKAVREGRIRLPRKPLSAIKPPDGPYELPLQWQWSRLGELIYIRSGDGLTKEAMRSGRIPVFGGNGVTGFHDTPNVREPTIVIGRVGYYCGSIHVTPAQAWVTDNAFVTDFCTEAIAQPFLVLLLTATNLKENENATAQPVISGSKIYPIVVGLPPLAEQCRIVAKVDELMALCDRLEASLTSGQDHSSRLLDALLAEALAPAEDMMPAERERVTALG
jgi:type I restriction enzyme S subunit